jgi:hypothetical protein
MGEKRNVCMILVGKPEGRIDVAEDRDQWRTLVNTVLNLRVP